MMTLYRALCFLLLAHFAAPFCTWNPLSSSLQPRPPLAARGAAVWSMRLSPVAEHEARQLLGVPRGASHDVLKSAFRFKAKTEHPDVSAAPDANERFQKLNAAFEQLEKAAAQTSQTSPPTAGGAGRAGVWDGASWGVAGAGKNGVGDRRQTAEQRRAHAAAAESAREAAAQHARSTAAAELAGREAQAFAREVFARCARDASASPPPTEESAVDDEFGHETAQRFRDDASRSRRAASAARCRDPIGTRASAASGAHTTVQQAKSPGVATSRNNIRRGPGGKVGGSGGSAWFDAEARFDAAAARATAYGGDREAGEGDPRGGELMAFGKYANSTMREVLAIDPAYGQWARRELRTRPQQTLGELRAFANYCETECTITGWCTVDYEEEDEDKEDDDDKEPEDETQERVGRVSRGAAGVGENGGKAARMAAARRRAVAASEVAASEAFALRARGASTAPLPNEACV